MLGIRRSSLRDANIIIGAGSNTILADDDDLLRPGDTAGGPYPELYTSADGALAWLSLDSV